MKSQYKIGTLFNVPVYLEISFIVFLLFVLFFGGIKSVLFLIAIFSIVLLHEFGHVLTAKYYNIETDEIVLNVLGGQARLGSSFLEAKPRVEFFISIAGPAVNVILAVFILPFYLLLENYSTYISLNDFVWQIITINCVLVIFNIIPAFPMDGGRILRSILCYWLDRITATKIALIISWVFALLMIIVGIMVLNFMLVLIAIFISFAGYAEYSILKQRHLNKFNKVMRKAASDGDIETVKLMLKNGANNLNSTMNNAAIYGHTEIVELMLKSGANKFNDTMEIAAQFGYIDIIKLMIEHSVKNFNEAMRIAKMNKHLEIVEFLEKQKSV